MVGIRLPIVKSQHERQRRRFFGEAIEPYMFTHAIVSVDGSMVAAYAASEIQVEFVAHENRARARIIPADLRATCASCLASKRGPGACRQRCLIPSLERTGQRLLRPNSPGLRAWVVLAALCFVYVLNFLDRQLLAILAKPIQDTLHVSDHQLGLIGGLYFALFYCFIAIPVGWLADRTNRTRVLALACAIWSGATMGCGIATNYLQLVAASVTVGFGEAGGVPPSYCDHFRLLSHRGAEARRSGSTTSGRRSVQRSVSLSGPQSQPLSAGAWPSSYWVRSA